MRKKGVSRHFRLQPRPRLSRDPPVWRRCLMASCKAISWEVRRFSFVFREGTCIAPPGKALGDLWQSSAQRAIMAGVIVLALIVAQKLIGQITLIRGFEGAAQNMNARSLSPNLLGGKTW